MEKITPNILPCIQLLFSFNRLKSYLFLQIIFLVILWEIMHKKQPNVIDKNGFKNLAGKEINFMMAEKQSRRQNDPTPFQILGRLTNWRLHRSKT